MPSYYRTRSQPVKNFGLSLLNFQQEMEQECISPNATKKLTNKISNLKTHVNGSTDKTMNGTMNCERNGMESKGAMDYVTNGTPVCARNGVKSNGTIMKPDCAKNGVETNGDHYFLTQLFKLMLKDGIDEGNDRNNKIVEFKHPKDLEQLLDLDITMPTSDNRLLEACGDVIKYSVKTG